MPEPRDEKYWRERATDAKARAATFTTSALKTDLLAPELKAELLALAGQAGLRIHEVAVNPGGDPGSPNSRMRVRRWLSGRNYRGNAA